MSERKTETLTDPIGRKIVVRALTVTEQGRMLRAMGEHAGNIQWAQLVQVAMITREIDGVPMPFPRDEKGIEQILDKLDDEGTWAVVNWRQKQIDDTMARFEAASKETSGPLDTSEPSPNTAP